jgi:hypothetical protein
MFSFQNFTEFYEQIEDFRKDNPNLHPSFLSDDNMQILQGITRVYTDVNNYLTNDERNIINRGNECVLKKEAGELMTLDMCKLILKRFNLEADRTTRQRVIREINNAVFDKLRQNNNQDKQEQITAIQNEWNKGRQHFAFLSSPILNELLNVLHKLENYVDELVIKDFLDRPGHKKTTSEKNISLRQLASGAKNLIKNEREKITAAMLARLTLAEKKNKPTNDDDVLLDTIEELSKYGLGQKFTKAIKSKITPREGLTETDRNKFNEYILAYGNPEEKDALRRLYPNGIPTSIENHSQIYHEKK